ncbi:MAG: 4'-phosphopantetheinyl transferase superfamily protein [Propionibacteriaceae bacterium]|nr:4'-phosphopantetheinyl transferase superfamily protein [Propionibacteriaceae bacterium]
MNHYRFSVHVSFSHSEDIVMVAACADESVGVDVERITRYPEKVANRMFSTAELRRLNRFDGVERDIEFFRVWTLKEAISKAWGLGMAMHFPQITVSRDALGWSTGCSWWTVSNGSLIASVAKVSAIQHQPKPTWYSLATVTAHMLHSETWRRMTS